MDLQSRISSHLKLAQHVFLVAMPVGALVGLAVAGYDWLVNTFFWERFRNGLSPQALCLLPIVGITLSAIILNIFRVRTSSMADEVVLAFHAPETGMDHRAAGPKLLASVATMAGGGSAGMEGPSKWLGGIIGSWIQKYINRVPVLWRLHGPIGVTMLAGAAAGIGAIFRAPLSGAIMAVESPYKKDLAHEALMQGLVASVTSFAVFSLFRSSAPYFVLPFHYELQMRDLVTSAVLGISAGLVSHFFLSGMGKIKNIWGDWQVPGWSKGLIGGAIVSLIAWGSFKIAAEPVSLQSGLPVAQKLVSGLYSWKLILVILVAKILATQFTFGTGGVGGLFLPSATIGAALGALFDVLLPAGHPGVFTLIGVAAFTGASYNSLLFSVVFVAEASGQPLLMIPAVIASATAFLTAAGISNSPSQRLSR